MKTTIKAATTTTKIQTELESTKLKKSGLNIANTVFSLNISEPLTS